MILPAWLVLSASGRPRLSFRLFRVIAGPTHCDVKLKGKPMDHVKHVKSRFGFPVFVSKRGDVLADMNGRAIVATAREIAMNRSAEDMQRLWAVRFQHARNATDDFLKAGDWVAA